MNLPSVRPDWTVMLGGAWLLHEARYNRTSFKTPFVNAITAKHDASKRIIILLIFHREKYSMSIRRHKIIIYKKIYIPISVRGDRQISLITRSKNIYHSLPSVITKLRLVSCKIISKAIKLILPIYSYFIIIDMNSISKLHLTVKYSFHIWLNNNAIQNRTNCAGSIRCFINTMLAWRYP